MKISHRQKHAIASYAAAALTKDDPDILATSCPLCKKTLGAATTTRVSDIAELVAEAIVQPGSPGIRSGRISQKTEPVSL